MSADIRDYLSGSRELMHMLPTGEFQESKVKRDGSGRFSTHSGAKVKNLKELRKVQLAEAKSMFGPEVMTMTLQEFAKSRPAGTRRETMTQVIDLLSKQFDDLVDAEEKFGHDGIEGIDFSVHATIYDMVQHGVRGMKWGVRRSPAQLKSAASKSDEPEVKQVQKLSGPETSATRYARLQAEARGGKASAMSDEDLKFFNARTEALSKVAKLNQQKPGWLGQTTKTVLQETAKRSMQQISNGLADKYINDKLTSKLKGNEDDSDQDTKKK